METNKSFHNISGVYNIFQLAFKIIRANIRNIFWILMVIYLPIYTMLRFFRFNLTTYSIALNLIDLFIGPFVIIIITCITARSLSESTPDNSFSILKLSLEKWVYVVLLLLLVYIVSSVLSVLIILPGLIFYVASSFAVYAVVLSDKKWLAAARYSWMLVKGYFWKVALFKLLFLIPIAINILIVYLFAKVNYGIQNNILSIGINIINEFLTIFVLVIDVILYSKLEETKNLGNRDCLVNSKETTKAEFVSDLELKPITSYKDPDYPIEAEARRNISLISPVHRKWGILKYAYTICILLVFLVAFRKEVNISSKDIYSYVQKCSQSDEVFLRNDINHLVGSAVSIQDKEIQRLKLEKEKMKLANMFFVSNSKSIEKAYWIINTIPDTELKEKIKSFIKVHKFTNLL